MHTLVTKKALGVRHLFSPTPLLSLPFQRVLQSQAGLVYSPVGSGAHNAACPSWGPTRVCQEKKQVSYLLVPQLFPHCPLG